MKTLTGVIVAILILGLIYTGFWFYQANHIEKLVAYHLKEYEKPNEDGYHVKVRDFTVIGYPFNYEVKLNNPRYEKAEDSQNTDKNFKIVVDGAVKFGTDVFGKNYWFKQDGDVNYILSSEGQNQNAKRYVTKGNSEVKVEVFHPQMLQAFFHPFFGLPKVFYKEAPSFQEIFRELKKADYVDSNFALYEVDANGRKPLIEFSKAWLGWIHSPESSENQNFEFNANIKELEASDKGQPLLQHLKKWTEEETPDSTANIAYLVGSGKNSVTLNFEVSLPKNFDSNNFLNYKDINVDLKKFDVENQYGQTNAQLNLSLKEPEQDKRNLHFNLNIGSLITQKGSEALHRQFIDSLKQQIKEQPEDPDNKIWVDLLKCCEASLQDIIPDYSNLGKMQFNFDTDVRFRNISSQLGIDKILLNNLDAFAEPYGITSHGKAEFVDEKPTGTYEIDWRNYKEMIHALVGYYNRIYPILEKFSGTNQQSLPIGIINETQEREIADFFKSISNDHQSEHSDITITVDFTDINNPKIGNSSWEQVKEAWDKLVSDLVKPVTKSESKLAPNVPSEAPKEEPSIPAKA